MAKLFFACSEIKFPFIFNFFLSFFLFCANGDAKIFLGYGAGTVLPVFVTTETKLSAEYIGLWVSYDAESPNKLLAIRKHVLHVLPLAYLDILN